MKALLEQTELKALTDPQFLNSLGFTPDKGILFLGGVGVGKTFTMKEISKGNRKGWGSIGQPTMYFKDSPIYEDDITGIGLSIFSSRNSSNSLNAFKEHDLYLDDIGAESESVNSFGNKFDPIAYILQMRYDVRNSFKTYITSNLSEYLLEERYGARVYSRIKDMCDIVIVKGGEDLRGRF